MAKHTPGPWVYCTRLSGSENHKGYYIKSKKFVLAFEVIPVDSDGKEGKANARLIAAAPDMLAALERIEEAAGSVESDETLSTAWIRNVCLEAIRQATGETDEP